MKSFLFLMLFAVVGCQRQPSDTGFKTLMIKAEGEVEALPDQAKFEVSLYCLESTVKGSKNCLVTKSNDLINKLTDFGVKKRDILTTAINMNRSYTWRNNSSVFEGYRSATTIIVTVKNINSLDEIYTELLENRNLELGGLSFSHSKMDSLQNEAYIKALKKSELLADRLLANLPENSREVHKIGNTEITSTARQPHRMMGDAVAEQASTVSNQSIGINTGTTIVKATLYVEYSIK